ncbi:hypothetical protein SLS58_009862 [Diplodia intermedia]|uniref:Uncharacterized protein n=1 Tax=Diplodia intermedia TaxID=856260 RepID=A0ABR3TAH0_9PEZI
MDTKTKMSRFTIDQGPPGHPSNQAVLRAAEDAGMAISPDAYKAILEDVRVQVFHLAAREQDGEKPLPWDEQLKQDRDSMISNMHKRPASAALPKFTRWWGSDALFRNYIKNHRKSIQSNFGEANIPLDLRVLDAGNRCVSAAVLRPPTPPEVSDDATPNLGQMTPKPRRIIDSRRVILELHAERMGRIRYIHMPPSLQDLLQTIPIKCPILHSSYLLASVVFYPYSHGDKRIKIDANDEAKYDLVWKRVQKALKGQDKDKKLRIPVQVNVRGFWEMRREKIELQ